MHNFPYRTLVFDLDGTLLNAENALNDLSMFQYAAYTVAMKNGNDQLKAVANEVTNGEDGIFRWLDKHI